MPRHIKIRSISILWFFLILTMILTGKLWLDPAPDRGTEVLSVPILYHFAEINPARAPDRNFSAGSPHKTSSRPRWPH